jgi:CDP-diacylglycerol---glycerol-3-phosphate 3-phosphatidyltransferase
VQKQSKLTGQFCAPSAAVVPVLLPIHFPDLHSFAAGRVTNQYLPRFASLRYPNYLQVPGTLTLTPRVSESIVAQVVQKGDKTSPPSAPFMNLPNGLTLLRIFIVPLLIVVLLTRSPNVELGGFPMHFEFWGVLILLVAAATDWADGFFARRRAQITTLGILLDPIADKLLICAAFISLVDMHLAKAWMVVIIIGRELVILGLRNIASAEGFTIAASTLGKTKMVLQVCAAAVLIYGARHPSFRTLGLALLWLVVISAIVSAAQYFYRFWNQLDDRIKQRKSLAVMEVHEVHKKPQDALPL